MKKNSKKEKPNCYECVHRLSLIGDAHSKCNNRKAKVTGNIHGIRSGWFMWPMNFDPVWLESCDGFSKNQKDKKPEFKDDPLVSALSILASVGR
jgi:hypothetical protein